MTPSQDGPKADSEGAGDLTSTIELLARTKRAGNAAVRLLVQRSFPPLKRWARGRLPDWARSLAETQDLVQDAVIRAIPHVQHFEARHPGALQAYLRQAIANHIRDEIRKVNSRPPIGGDLPESKVDPGPSPLERAIGRERLDRYDAALAKLRPVEREAIVARLELQQSYEEVALALGKPSADAARMLVARAVKNLIRAMDD